MKLKTLKRLEYVSNMISKYKHCYDGSKDVPCSERMQNWLDEYNSYKEEAPEIFNKFCELKGYSKDHDCYDVLA